MSLKPLQADANPPISHPMPFADLDWQARCSQRSVAVVHPPECLSVTQSFEPEAELQSLSSEGLLGVWQESVYQSQMMQETGTGTVGCLPRASCTAHAV